MRFAAILAAVALIAGCDLVQKIENRKILMGAVLASPQVNALNVSKASVTSAQLFFGERQSDLNQAPTPLAASSVTLGWDGNPAGVALAPVTGKEGWHQAIGSIPYTPGVNYTFTVVYQGETFSGTVAAPSAPTIKNAPDHLFPPETYSEFTSLTLQRDGTADAFYAAFDAASSTDLDAATCTNAPVNDAGTLLQFVLDDAAWKAASFDLPKSPCFPSAGTYVVSLTTVEKSSSVSSNLFLGSAVMAGASDGAVFVLQ
jgi:hypothetical protein